MNDSAAGRMRGGLRFDTVPKLTKHTACSRSDNLKSSRMRGDDSALPLVSPLPNPSALARIRASP